MICFGSAVSEFPEPLCYHHHAGKKKRQHPQSLGIGVCLMRCYCWHYSQRLWLLHWLGVSIMPLFFLSIMHLAVASCPLGAGDICCSNVGFENELQPRRNLYKITPKAESIGLFNYRRCFDPWAALGILGQHFTFVSILQFLIMKLES